MKKIVETEGAARVKRTGGRGGREVGWRTTFCTRSLLLLEISAQPRKLPSVYLARVRRSKRCNPSGPSALVELLWGRGAIVGGFQQSFESLFSYIPVPTMRCSKRRRPSGAPNMTSAVAGGGWGGRTHPPRKFACSHVREGQAL